MVAAQARIQALSEQDVVAARAELADGRAVTVWFTASAVGVPAGGSAKIVAVEELAEGDFIQVRPTGSRDTMFCSSGELTRTRPPRKQAGAPQARHAADRARTGPPARSAAGRVTGPAAGRTTESAAGRVSEPPAGPATERPAGRVVEPADRPRAGAKAVAAATSTASSAVPAERAAQDPTPAPGPPPEDRVPDRPRSGGRARPPAEVSVTLSATGDGEWTVEVMVGKKRTVRPTPVQPGDVAVAARALPPAVAEAISSSLDAARRRRAEQVERLRAELDAAERALKELNG